MIAVCPALQQKKLNRSPKKAKSVGFIQTISPPGRPDAGADEETVHYSPFITRGTVSFTKDGAVQVPVTILRDTGADMSLLLYNVLPFSSSSFSGSDVLVWGVGMVPVRAPRHAVYLSSLLVTDPVEIATRDCLPMRGVHLILGNDLAGKKVFPTPEVVDDPVCDCDPSVSPAAFCPSSVFPLCVVMRAQSRKFADVCNLTLFCVQMRSLEAQTALQ